MHGLSYFAQVEVGIVEVTLNDCQVAFAGGGATMEEFQKRNNMTVQVTTEKSADAVNFAIH